LGDGSIIDNNTATIISTLTGIVMAEAGGIHTLFVKSDGTVWSCGLNSGGNNDGQLGDGTNIDKSTPVQVVASWGAQKVTEAHAAREHSIFYTDKGELWASGRNNYGQLGYGQFTTGNSNTPVKTLFDCGKPVSVYNSVHENNTSYVYPNPASDILTIETKYATTRFVLADIAGSVILDIILQGTKTNIDISRLNSGLYIYYQYNEQDITTTGKILVAR
jgi:alpha-tubulin suppressor-like RCC1 family protein